MCSRGAGNLFAAELRLAAKNGCDSLASLHIRAVVQTMLCSRVCFQGVLATCS